MEAKEPMKLKTFVNESGKNFEAKKESDFETFKCLNCSLEFHQYDLELHNLNCEVKLKVRTIKCVFCEKVFASENDLNGHINTIHEHEKYPKTFECKTCGKYFRSNSYLKQHKDVVHGGTKVYKCKTCEKVFSTNWTLQQHFTVVHEKEKKYQCNFCSRSFSVLGNLQKHIETVHEGKKKCSNELSTKALLE